MADHTRIPDIPDLAGHREGEDPIGEGLTRGILDGDISLIASGIRVTHREGHGGLRQLDHRAAGLAALAHEGQ
jgi:hypothetical protein